MSTNKNVYLYTFIAVNGGLLFGLNMSGISAGVDDIKTAFSLSEGGIGFIVSVMTIGCLFGSLFTGKLADAISRKNVFILSAIVMAIASLGLFLANSAALLILFRFLAGLSVGAVSVVSPMYISEIAPSEKRGTLISFNQFAITAGILLAYLFNYLFRKFIPADSSIADWHYMLGIPFIFSVLFLILTLLFLPKSPRWLIGKGRHEEGLKVLEKTVGVEKARTTLSEIQSSLNSEVNKTEVRFGEIFKGKIGYVVFLGTLLAIFQQIIGINAVINYAPSIFSATGVGGSSALLQSVLLGAINFLFTIVALSLVDKVGRKVLLLCGSVGMFLSLLFLTLAFGLNWSTQYPVTVLVAVLVFIAFFAATWAPIMWVVISEIYPNKVRSVAQSFSTAVSWAFTFLTVQFSPWILKNWGGEYLFGIFGVFALISYFFVLKYIPETKGKSLEQIERELNL